MPTAVVAVVEAHWGWSIREPGYSAGGPSLPIPPPSTVGVALLAHLLARRGREVVRTPQGLVYASMLAIRALRTATAGLLRGGVVVARDVAKYLTIPYQSPDNRRNPSLWFAAQAFGITVAPSARLCLAAVYDEKELARIGVRVEELEESAYSLTRLGSREGLVTVERVWVSRAERSVAGEGEKTLLYAPKDGFEKGPGYRIVDIRLWDHRDPQLYTPKPPRKPSLPGELVVSIPVSELSSRTILLAPEEPGVLSKGIVVYRPREAPRECSVIPTV